MNRDESARLRVGTELNREISAAVGVAVAHQLAGVSARRVVAAADEPSRAAQLQTEPTCVATGTTPGAGQFLGIESHGRIAPGGLSLCRPLLRRVLDGRQPCIHNRLIITEEMSPQRRVQHVHHLAGPDSLEALHVPGERTPETRQHALPVLLPAGDVIEPVLQTRSEPVVDVLIEEMREER